MSQLSTQVVTRCKGCGATLIIVAVDIRVPDPEGALLMAATKDLAQNSYCDACQHARELGYL